MNEQNLSDEALAELLTLTVEVNKQGTIRYLNHLGQLHRIHGPAIIYPGGASSWFLNGQRHRADGPAYMCADGQHYWWLNGLSFTRADFNERTRSL